MSIRKAAPWAFATFLTTGILIGQEEKKNEEPESTEELRERLREQDRRIADLEKRLGPSDAIPPAPAEKKEGEKSPIDFIRWNEVSALGSRFKLYGFLRLDTIFDDSRPNNTQVVAWIRSEDDDAPSTIGADENDSTLTMHPRLSRLGIDFDGPVVAALNGAKPTGKLEIDFYNVGLLGQTESRSAIRMRHAYVRLGWQRLFILAGQTNDLISPLFPVVNPDLVMWGAGNLGDRRPQARVEYFREVGRGRLTLGGMVGLTGADDNQDLDGNLYRDGEASGLPTLQARLSYRLPFEKTAFEVGVYGHRAWEEVDVAIAGTGITDEEDFDSHAYGVDLTVPIFTPVLLLKGEAWIGANADDVRGGIFQGVNTTAAEEIRSRGGWVELGWQAFKWYLVSIGYSTDDPQASDLNTTGRAANRIAYFSNRWYFDPIEFGLDYLYWRTDFVGFGPGDDNRFQAYISYKF